MKTTKKQKKNNSENNLKKLMRELRKYFPKDTYTIYYEKLFNMIVVKYEDVYEYFRIDIELNKYGKPEAVTITKGDLTEEIMSPGSCHYCFHSCSFFDVEAEQCKYTYEEFDKILDEWVKVLYESPTIKIEKTFITMDCNVDIPHQHFYKAYSITYRQYASAKTISALSEIFDVLVSLVRK